MITSTYILCAVIISIGAFVASMLGVGGGLVFTPVQTLLGFDIHVAAANSLFLIVLLSASATYVYGRVKKVDWHLAVVLSAATVGGGFIGGFISDFVISEILSAILIAALLFSAAMMLRNQRTPDSAQSSLSSFHWNRAREGSKYSVNLPVALAAALASGLLSGLIGIGGGLLMVPIMIAVLRIPTDIAIATSAFMVGLTACGGFAGHLLTGQWDWKFSLIIAPLVILGAHLGARTMLSIDRLVLRRIFAIFLALMALVLVLKLF